MVDFTIPALFKHYTTLFKHSTDSAITFTAFRNLNTTSRTDNLSPCLLVVEWIRSRTVQPVVSRYTDWATRSTHVHINEQQAHTYTYGRICIVR